MQSLSELISATFSESPAASPSPSPLHDNIQVNACDLCSTPFSISRLRHQCRKCGSVVCGGCSKGRARLEPGGDKERVCRECEASIRATNIEEIEENADVRMQINTSLRVLLKKKYEEIEEFKKQLIELVNSDDLLKEPPTLTHPRRFEVTTSTDRINFTDLVKYVDGCLQKLTKDHETLLKKYKSESSDIDRRRANFQLLQDRTHRAETNAETVKELVKQRDRLKETHAQQDATLRALQDRVEMMEQRIHQRSNSSRDPTEFHVMENDLIADDLADRIFPCLKIA